MALVFKGVLKNGWDFDGYIKSGMGDWSRGSGEETVKAPRGKTMIV